MCLMICSIAYRMQDYLLQIHGYIRELFTFFVLTVMDNQYIWQLLEVLDALAV